MKTTDKTPLVPLADARKAEEISTDNLLLFLNLNVLEKYCRQTFELYANVFAIKRFILLMVLFFAVLGMDAQQTILKKSGSRPSVTVLNIDTKGLMLDPVQMGNMVRLELEKLDTFEVMDRYDVSYVVEKNKLNIKDRKSGV